MFEKITESYLKEKKIYILKDHGWYYEREILCVEDEAEAITTWEKLTKIPFTDYQKYLDSANCKSEGHWYYSLESTTLWDIFQKELVSHKGKIIREETKQIQDQGNKMIEIAARRQAQEEVARVLSGMEYYLSKALDFSYRKDYDKKKEAFEQLTEKF